MLSPSLFLFLIMYLLSFMLVLGFDSWVIVWVGLEINMISFIMVMFRHYSSLNMESCLKYFFIQASGSAMLIFLWVHDFVSVNLFLLVLSFKLGAGPFYFWLPSVAGGVDWMSVFMLLGFQKIMPLILMSSMVGDVIWFMSIVSMIVGCYGMMNQVCLSKFMTFSSIHHLGWMMLLLYTVEDYWVIYLMLYMILVFPLMFYFMKFGMDFVDELMEVSDKFLLCLGVLSLAGIPPMLGFFLKMWAFKMLMEVSMFFFLFMILMSVIMVYIYVKLVYKMIMWEVNANLVVSVINVDIMMLVMWMYVVGFVVGMMMIWI